VAEPNKQAIHFQALENKIKSSVEITALLVSTQLQLNYFLRFFALGHIMFPTGSQTKTDGAR
jgi:hypothetical protein